MLSLLLLQGSNFVVQNGGPRLSIDRRSGAYSVVWSDDAAVRAAVGEARLADGRNLKTSLYPRHEVSTERVRDALGDAIRVVVRHRGEEGPELRQTFWLYAKRSEVVVRLDVLGADGTASITPVATDETVIENAPQTLFVPYDNDAYGRYRSDGKETSYEVGAVYDAASRRGVVVGSIDHDVWKSGVSFQKGLRAWAGVADAATRDREPHGIVRGREVRSPRFVLGRYDDWRAGLERYGDLNALVRPPLLWNGGVPFGWNSWAAHKDKLKAASAQAATAFLAEMPAFRNDGTASVNLDSFWDNLKPGELAAFVRDAHAKGLRAGIYWTPFVAWGGLESPVRDDPHGYRYRDLALKDAKGEPLPKLDGGWPLDPTHPGTLARIDRQLAQFVRQGFDFVKLDFMTHGALEGRHFDPKVATGTAAYTLGMRRIVDDLAFKRIRRPFFVSLSIAPLFPQGYAHSRRISCDVFADIGASEYLLNAATYGWWTADRLYRFNDPDHTVVHHAMGDPPTSEAEGRTRLVASIVSGGMLLMGDDLGDPAAQERVRRLFGNEAALDLARKAPAFRPIDGDSGERAGDAFVWKDGDIRYVAVFNYDRASSKKRTIPLARLGLAGAWTMRPVVGRASLDARELAFDLPPTDCALVRLERPR